MANFYADNDDLQFYVEKGIDWSPLVDLVEDGFTAEDGFENLDDALYFYREVLSMIGKFVGHEIAPHVPTIDRDEPHLRDG